MKVPERPKILNVGVSYGKMCVDRGVTCDMIANVNLPASDHVTDHFSSIIFGLISGIWSIGYIV